MKWVVIKVPENDGVISKSAWFFDTFQEAVDHRAASPYNTVLAEAVEHTPTLLEKFLNWLYNGKSAV